MGQVCVCSEGVCGLAYVAVFLCLCLGRCRVLWAKGVCVAIVIEDCGALKEKEKFLRRNFICDDD